MPISISMNTRHQVVSVHRHFYETPTEPLYLDRILQCHDFIYLVDGQWLVTENDTDYLLRKDDVLLLSAGHHHYTRLPCAPKTRTICMHISNEELDLSDNAGNLILPTFLHAGSATIRRCFERIADDFWRDIPYKRERLSVQLDMLMLELSDALNTPLRSTGLIRQVIDMINAQPHIRFRTSDIAEHFSITTKTLDKQMQQQTGMTFAKYQNAHKLEMVASFLTAEPCIPLAEVASLFGFCDEFHLSRAFKTYFNVSPSQYRIHAAKLEQTETLKRRD